MKTHELVTVRKLFSNGASDESEKKVILNNAKRF